MQLKVPCRTRQGRILTRWVTVYYVDRGLAVQRDSWAEAAGAAVWGVVHVPSCQLVASGAMPSRARARQCQLALLALPIDWTHAADAAWQLQIAPLARPVLQAYAADMTF